MMQRKFQYILMGAGLTLLVILGALAFLLPQAQADTIVAVPTSEPSADTVIEVERPTTTAIVSTNELEETINTDTEVQVAGAEQVEVVIVEEQPTSADLGTLENPVTDITKIIAQVEALAEIYQANVLGKAGWFYHRYEDYSPAEFHSNTGEISGIPLAELYPDDTMVRQEWLLVDASGQSSEKVGYVTDQAGIIRGSWVTAAGKTVLLHMVGADPDAISEAPPRLDRLTYVEDLVGILEVVRKDPFISVTAWQEGNVYALVLGTTYEELKTFGNINYAVFLGKQSIYRFDLSSGAIQQIEFVLQDVNNTFITRERITYLERTYVDAHELPPIAAQIMNEAITLIEEVE